MMGSEAAMFSSDWGPAVGRLRRRLGRLDILWSSKRGRKRAAPRQLFVADIELFQQRFGRIKRQAACVARNALSNLAKSFGGALSKRSVLPVAGCSKPRDRKSTRLNSSHD